MKGTRNMCDRPFVRSRANSQKSKWNSQKTYLPKKVHKNKACTTINRVGTHVWQVSLYKQNGPTLLVLTTQIIHHRGRSSENFSCFCVLRTRRFSRIHTKYNTLIFAVAEKAKHGCIALLNFIVIHVDPKKDLTIIDFSCRQFILEIQ